jgi:hypothetical protein
MITAMMERNHTLNIWRYVLVAICLLLVGLSGYLFRLKENYRGELIREEALHAQDAVVYEYEMERNRAAVWDTVRNWHELRLLEEPLDSGTLRIHLPANGKVVLVDLSGIRPPEPGLAYYLFTEAAEDDPRPEVVTAAGQDRLHALPLSPSANHLRLYEWKQGVTDYPLTGSRPIARVSLPVDR